ncbi:MAG TPA: hypothetical protein DCP06_04860 [Lachnospiraceae bacterium]|nr:hypothetical protein [Lachnospiraceae bacterium]
MIDKEKAEGFVDKAVDFLNENGEKIKDFAKEHELDKKVEEAAGMLEEGAKDVINGVKNKLGK